MLHFALRDGATTMEQMLLVARFNRLIRKYPNLAASASSPKTLSPRPSVALPPSAAQRRKIGGDRERMFIYATRHTWKHLTHGDDDHPDDSVDNKRE